jgi:hypothetical protein
VPYSTWKEAVKELVDRVICHPVLVEVKPQVGNEWATGISGGQAVLPKQLITVQQGVLRPWGQPGPLIGCRIDCAKMLGPQPPEHLRWLIVGRTAS